MKYFQLRFSNGLCLFISCGILVWSITLTPEVSLARTWYITPDGTGDAPTIRAGVDSAEAGDTVLVAPGIYEIRPIEMKEGITLTSEEGCYYTKLIPLLVPGDYPLCAIACNSFQGLKTTEISGFWIEGFEYSTLGAIDLFRCYGTYVRHNILTGNTIGLRIANGGFSYIEFNTIYSDGYGFEADTGEGVVRQNIFWCRVLDVSGTVCYCNDFLDISDCAFPSQNFSQDPQFCGVPGSGNFYLQSDSPCAPGNDPIWVECDLIGALPVNCGSVDVKKKTWGEIKTLYQD